MDLHRPAASSLSGYDMMAEFWPRLAEEEEDEEEEDEEGLISGTGSGLWTRLL